MRTMRALLIFSLALGAWFFWATRAPALSSASLIAPVPAGASAARVARELKNAGVIRSAWAFSLVARLSGAQAKLKAGDYEVPAGLDVFKLLDLLVSGRSLVHQFLVPEGWSATQIANRLSQAKLSDSAGFLAVVRDPAQAKKLGLPGSGLEGYLFPDTYTIPRGYSPERLAQVMARRFSEMVSPELLAQGAGLGLSPAQVVTLASILEKETRDPTELPKVSAVFHNRLKAKQRLESCATVRYALGKFSGPLYFVDLDVKSPYNTYRHRGLPPGPICSPGLNALRAAVEPAVSDALFFVVAGDGTHIFSKTFEEHKNAKFRYKRLKKGVAEE